VVPQPILPPLHAKALPFVLDIQLACALCTGIMLTSTTTVAVTSAKAIAAIVTEVFSLCIFFVSFSFEFVLFDRYLII
jgi:hypothetical protein